LRSRKGHNDLGADAAGGGVEGDSLGVIAGTGGDDSLVALGLVECEQLVERSTLFEGAGALQVFQLEMEGQADKLRKMMRKLAGRNVNGFADAGAGGLDAGETYGFQLRFSFMFVRDEALRKLSGMKP
jgi:hypothetical protein